jgi:phenylalanyl-tRNA synthetase beta chain
MLISHNWLKTYFKNPEKLPSPEEIGELFTMHAFEIESLEQKGDDYIYDIKITPDRGPYAYGLRYVALELSLIIPELIIDENIRFDISKKDLENTKTVMNTVLVPEELKKLCPVYSLTKIENIQNTESSDWVKKNLTAIDQSPRSLLVDLTNLIMFDVGQPLHVFDADKVDGQIRVALSTEGQTITILGGKEIKLETGTLVIRDDKDILAIAGVKGGIKAEVDSNTKNVYLESANFNQTIVRKTARALNLLNDSSKRFEQGLNKERFLLAVQDYIHLLTWDKKDIIVHDIEVSDSIENILSGDNKKKIDINIDNLSLIIDKDNDKIPELLKDFIENVLIKTGAEVIKKDDKNYTIIAPYHRSDMNIDVDIADEFLRNKSFEFLNYDENFASGLQTSSGLKSNTDKLIYNIRKYFKEKDFDEAILHTLVDSKINSEAIKLDNSLTADRDSLRSDLKKNIIKSIENNFKYLDLVSKNMVKVFEIGKVFSEEGNDIIEKTHLAFALGMVKWPKGESKEDMINNIIKDLNLPQDNVKIEIINNVIIAEIDLDDMSSDNIDQGVMDNYMSQSALIKNRKYKAGSTYPAMSRDIAFFVGDDLGKTESDIENMIKDLVNKYPVIENYFRFDIFKKDGKTSYAYRFVFQSYEKTLTEDETKEWMGEVGGVLIGAGFEVR